MGIYNTLIYTHTNMGTKLSKNENKETITAKEEEVKVVDIEADTEAGAASEDVDESVKTLKDDSFDRSSGFGKNLRKSMRKFVAKKKVKSGKKEEPVEKQDVTPSTSEATEEKVKDENNFKTAQQKARAEFFKEMYEEGKYGKTKTTEDTTEATEGVNTSVKHDSTNEVSVSLIGSPQCDENQEATKTAAETELIEISEDPVQVQVDDHVTQDEQEIEKESLSAASTEHEVPNEVEEMQFVIVPEE